MPTLRVGWRPSATTSMRVWPSELTPVWSWPPSTTQCNDGVRLPARSITPISQVSMSMPITALLASRALATAGLEQSMSRAGNCFDNATMFCWSAEWSTLKTDTAWEEAIPPTRHHAQPAVFDYIETFCNPTRRHSSPGYLSPVVFENKDTNNDIETA